MPKPSTSINRHGLPLFLAKIIALDVEMLTSNTWLTLFGPFPGNTVGKPFPCTVGISSKSGGLILWQIICQIVLALICTGGKYQTDKINSYLWQKDEQYHITLHSYQTPKM